MSIRDELKFIADNEPNLTESRSRSAADHEGDQEPPAVLQSVGLDYLTLARSAGTLSGGESQRIRLTTQIGSALSGVLYVLDEPSIGLHQRDNDKLIATLKNLRDLGNTVIVVEHDEDTMRSADYIVDVGPGAASTAARSWPQAPSRTSARPSAASPATTCRAASASRCRRPAAPATAISSR